LYPERWEAFRDAIPEHERNDFITAYHKRLTSDDPAVRLPAAISWATWERTISNLIPPVQCICLLPLRRRKVDFHVLVLQADAAAKVASSTRATEAFARIENHYLFHKGFLSADDFLLTNASKIRHIPTVIVHGR
jgi:proline iminopeptidase